MEPVKVFCMTRDEYDIIEDFMAYYGYLFGYHNVYIIDNMSRDPRVLEAYDRYSRMGVTVVQEESFEKDDQAAAYTKHMKPHKEDCEFMLGLDTDEFLVPSSLLPVKGNDSSHQTDSIVEREKVLKTFADLSKEHTLFKINEYSYSLVDVKSEEFRRGRYEYPARSIDSFFVSQICGTKMFCRSSAYKESGMGNHEVYVEHGVMTTADICYLHLHNTGTKRMYERSKQAVDGYKYADVTAPIREQLRQIKNAPKWHGFHRRDFYALYLTRMFVVDLFREHIKRYPSYWELDYHSFGAVKKTPEEIEELFAGCEEATSRKDAERLEKCDEVEEDLVFVEKPFMIRGHQTLFSGIGFSANYVFFRTDLLKNTLRRIHETTFSSSTEEKEA